MFFQAEGGIRDGHVTGVQTCALPIFGQLAEVGAGRLEVLVRAEGGDDAAGEGRVLRQGRVGGEVVDRVVGGGEHLDAEALEQGRSEEHTSETPVTWPTRMPSSA